MEIDCKNGYNREAAGVVGVFSVGHDIYWPQFPELKDKLMVHSQYFVNELKHKAHAQIISYQDICDNSHKAFAAGDFFARQQLDLLICFVATYTPSGNVLPVVQKADVPVILVALQPAEGMDYQKSTIAIQLENDNIVSLPEISGAMIRAHRKPLDTIVGTLYDDIEAWERLLNWCEVATVINDLKNARIGYLGHVYEGMLDMNSDPTMFSGHFGMHIEHIEMDDLKVCIDQVNEDEVNEKLTKIKQVFDFPEPGFDPVTKKVEDKHLQWPACVACGMDKLVEKFKLDGLAYYYRGLNNNLYERIHAAMIIGNSFLTTEGIPIAGEKDLKNCVAMMIMDRLRAGGSFCEFHPVDFNEDFVLVGHDGPHHLAVAEGKPVLRELSLYHGKRGQGPSVEYKLKVGPITMLGLTQTSDGRFKFVIAEGESLPGPIPATGNTNTRGQFKPDVRTFLEKWAMAGPTHHFALGVGHIAHKLEMLARVLEIECKVVTPQKN